MDTSPPKAVYFHFRFKFLAITSIAFLIYLLTSTAELQEFTSSFQFQLMGPFFILSGLFFLIFRRVPLKCPYCNKLMSTKKDWTCCECGKSQGKLRYLIDKCFHCRQVQATGQCEHCNSTYRL